MRLLLSIIAISPVFLTSCDKRQDDEGLRALGITSTPLPRSGVSRISVERETGGAREELISTDLPSKGGRLYIQLGLPGKQMRVAVAGPEGSLTSSYAPDVFNEHPMVFLPVRTGDGTGEYVLIETNAAEPAPRNRLILIAE